MTTPRFVTLLVVWTCLDVVHRFLLPSLLSLSSSSSSSSNTAVVLVPSLVPSLLLLVSAASTQTQTATSNKVGGECIPLAKDPSRFHCYDISATLEDKDDHDNDDNDADLLEDTTTCMDTEKECKEWMEKGECSRNPNYMLIFCPHSCETCITGHAGVVQVSLHHDEGGNPRRVVERLTQTQNYVQTKVSSNIRFLHSCKNKHELCTHWATLGECESNPNYMLKECAAACRKCH